MFRFRPNGTVLRCLLTWTFNRLTVPPTFRPGARIRWQQQTEPTHQRW